MEHIVVSNSMHHFDNHQTLSNLQHGFRRGHSCETQLIAFVEDLAKEMQNGGQTDVIVMDFSKAFDKVPHQELLYKLSNYGINIVTLSWLKSFLSNRKQRVVLEGVMSDQVPVSSGVPQGSVLGPILFLAYINDLPQYVKSKVRLFADDTVIYLAIKSSVDCIQLQQDLLSLENWESDWKMEFNAAKCNVLRITKKKTPYVYDYQLKGQTLESLHSVKYLGVYLSDDLRWNEHVNNMSNRANKTLGFLKRNLRHCPPKTKETAYKALVRPTLEYCSTVWDPYTAKNINVVEMVQRRAARWVLNCFNRKDSVTAMLSTLKWKTLESRRTIARLSMLYKMRNRLVFYDDIKLQPVDHLYSTRFKEYAYKQPITTRNYYKYSFHPRTISEWNKLPREIVLSSSLVAFKNAIFNMY